MNAARRLPFLGRLAKRYALRHRGQTFRAILGLLVATTVLMAGLGMGESLARSLEESALARFGPIDITVQSPSPFAVADAEHALRDPALTAMQVRGAPTLVSTGTTLHAATGLAEAFTTIRGITAGEARALGPLVAPDGSIVREPGPGEAVISRSLADSIDAGIGASVTLRAPRIGDFEDFAPEVEPVTGVAAPQPTTSATHSLVVRDRALGLGGQITWQVELGSVTMEAVGPNGERFTNTSATSPLAIVVTEPPAAGTWTIRVTATIPTAYAGGIGALYAPTVAEAFASLDVRVIGIVKDEGRSGITTRPTALVPLADLQRATSLDGRVTTMYVTAPGDGQAAADAVEAALRGVGVEEAEVRAVKADAIENAAEAGAQITGFLLVMGGFSLVASVLLAFALFSALVQERRVELGVARALGLTRGEVAFTMTLEGALYAALAAFAGLLLGLALLAAFMFGLNAVSAAEGGPAFGVKVGMETIVLTFVIGTLLPLLTIGVASLRFARLDPSRALRDVPEDASARRRGSLIAGIAISLLGLAFLPGELTWLIGVPILLAGLGVIASSFGRPLWGVVGVLFTFASVAHAVWSLYAFTTFPEDAHELDPVLTMARGLVLALTVSALAVSSSRPYLAVARLANRGGKSPRAFFMALKYLIARRMAAGLTMAMIATVVVVVTVMGSLFIVFSDAFEFPEGSYDVVGDSPLLLDALPHPLPADIRESVEALDMAVRHRAIRSVNLTENGEEPFDRPPRTFIGISASMAANGALPLDKRADAFASDAEAWTAVAAGDALILPSWLLDERDPGFTVTLALQRNVTKDYVVAATVQQWGVFLADEDVRSMGFPLSSSVYVRTTPEADPGVVANRLNAEYEQEGMTFVSIPDEIARAQAAAQALILVFEAFLGLGLFIGLAATGFLASRAVHERIREIGTLRALGYEPKDVRRVFVLESTITAALGILIGTAVGVVVAHSVWYRALGDQDVPFRPPWWIMLGFTIAVVGLAALASWRPARRAADVAPAMAVRYVE